MSRFMLAATVVLACATCLLGDDDSAQPQVRRPAATTETELQKAIDEFKSVTHELGLRPDSPHKEGGNGRVKPAWHGRLFENFRNDFLDAVPHEVRQNGEDASALRRNQFGFNVAGPVVIPRLYDGSRVTFFSLSYEGVRETIARSFLRTVPTLAEHGGDWSSTVDSAGNPLAIYDPLSTRLNPDYDPTQPVSLANLQYERDTFPGNRIPTDRIDPVANKALEYYPAPNTAVGPFYRNNYFIHSPEGNTANGMIGKIDHTLNERHRATLGFSYSNGKYSAAQWFPTAANPGSPDRDFHNRRGTFGHVFTISPRTVNSFSFEASSEGSVSGSQDQTNYPSLLGLNGVEGSIFPLFYFADDYLSMGQWASLSDNVRNSYIWTDSFSTRRGKHSLHATAQWLSHQVNTYRPNSPSGTFSFNSGLTSLPGIVNTGHEFASFLLGMPASVDMSLVSSPSYFRYGGSNLSVSDSYEAAQGLTFSLGLNIHTSRPREEKYDRQSTVDLSAINSANGRPGALVFPGETPFGRRLQPIRTKFEPSAGVAWNPRGSSKTVVRANFWRGYSGVPVYFGQWGTQGFNADFTFVSSNAQLEPALLLAQGLPPYTLPLPNRTATAANDLTADLFEADPRRQPLSQEARLSVEHELPGALVLTLGAVYSGGKDQYVSENVANPDAAPLEVLKYRDLLNDESFNRSLRPYPQYLGFSLGGLYPAGKYQRDVGYLRVEKRASQGLTLSASYEFSKSMDDYSGPYGSQDFYNRGNEWSLNAWNSPHRFSLTYNYELPLGANKPFLSFNDWRHYLVDGWSVSGTATVLSGAPLAIHPEFNNTGGVVTALNVNVVPGVDPRVADPSPELWFNPAAFEQPADFTIGNASRTNPVLRGPISQNQDVSLTKRFALAADRAVEFSAVGLNFLNHANWNDPDTTIGPASAPNVNAGKIIGSRGGRVVQLGLRLSF
ncbi:MAG TPA: hypothetical protein VHA11_00250 [Bryobacteraceae bacterium]|nr:hypothetical protein [Bryobacteraceae bacterium]